jgi:hypothetical protein
MVMVNNDKSAEEIEAELSSIFGPAKEFGAWFAEQVGLILRVHSLLPSTLAFFPRPCLPPLPIIITMLTYHPLPRHHHRNVVCC